MTLLLTVLKIRKQPKNHCQPPTYVPSSLLPSCHSGQTTMLLDKASTFVWSFIPSHLLKDIVSPGSFFPSAYTPCISYTKKQKQKLPSYISFSTTNSFSSPNTGKFKRTIYTHPLHLLFSYPFSKLLQAGFHHHHSPETM